jgi:hypothetical protein
VEHAPSRWLAVGLAAIAVPTAAVTLWLVPGVLGWRAFAGFAVAGAALIGSVAFALRAGAASTLILALGGGAAIGWPVARARDAHADDVAFASARAGDAAALDRYLRGPALRHRAEAARLLPEYAWRGVAKFSSVPALRAYEKRFPAAHQADVAAAIHARFTSVSADVAADLDPFVTWFEDHAGVGGVEVIGCDGIDLVGAVLDGVGRAIPADLAPFHAGLTSDARLSVTCTVIDTGELYDAPTGAVAGAGLRVMVRFLAPGVDASRTIEATPPDKVTASRVLIAVDAKYARNALARAAVEDVPAKLAAALAR